MHDLFGNMWAMVIIGIFIVLAIAIAMAMSLGGASSSTIRGGSNKRLPLDDLIYGYTPKPYNGPKPLNINKDTTIADVANQHHINKNTKLGDLEPEPEPEPEPEIITKEQTPEVTNILDEMNIPKNNSSGFPDNLKYVMHDPTELGAVI